MNTLTDTLVFERDTITEIPNSPWVSDFIKQIGTRVNGENLSRLVEPKPNVKQTVIDFAGDVLPDEVINIAEIAHLAELVYHESLGKNIRRSLGRTLFIDHGLTDEQSCYTKEILSNFPVLNAYAKEAHGIEDKPLRLKLLKEKLPSLDIESIIVKSALDYSNFMLLEGKPELSRQEAQKMERTISSIRLTDSILLETAGYDALAAEMLDKVYRYELEREGHGRYVDEASKIFESLGGRNALGSRAQEFLNELFHEDNSLHYQVTANQTNYAMYFTDGEVALPGSDESFRALSRLKSTGATAKKMHHNHTNKGAEAYEIPADIIATTFIAKDIAGMKTMLHHATQRLEQMGVEFVSAPGRVEQVHIKGERASFINEFTGDDRVSLFGNLSIDEEVCQNGYEAVKLLIRHNGIPIEMQFTHEASRKASRTGPASHTYIKLVKLYGTDIISELFTEEELVEFLSECNRSAGELSKENLTTVPDSKARAEKLDTRVAREMTLEMCYMATEQLGVLASQKCALVV